MSANKAACMQYKENSIFTATPEELALMLYNGLIKYIIQAQKAMENGKDLVKAHNSIIRAQNILIYMQNTLDRKYDISTNLYLLYDYMCRRLIDANVKKSCEILEEVLGLARELRDTWVEAMKIVRRQGKTQDSKAQQMVSLIDK